MARSILLTVLGEAVAPYGNTVWQESLVAALTTLGTSAPAARQVVARAMRDGWLTSERVGRRSLLTISESSLKMLEEGRARALVFGAAADWDGQWLLAAVTVPEEQRELRYQLRTQLGWLGFGSLGNGLWISPHVDHQDDAVELLRSWDESVNAVVFVTATSCESAMRRSCPSTASRGRPRRRTCSPPGSGCSPPGGTSRSSTPSCRIRCCRRAGPGRGRARCSPTATSNGRMSPSSTSAHSEPSRGLRSYR
jgi:hypothetical protein